MHLNPTAEPPPCECIRGHKHCGNIAFFEHVFCSQKNSQEGKLKPGSKKNILCGHID